ncbi:MAG: hypothetical protein IJ309_06925 [Clostridia bacterium]|nr:hypothetical protein [Clostridia bacterium]
MAVFLQSNLNIVDTSTIIWAICIGANLAFIATFLIRNFNGIIVRRLLDRGVGQTHAYTLGELGISGALLFVCKRLLRDGAVLRNTVSCVGGQIPQVPIEKKTDEKTQKEIEPAFRPAYEQARFYIDESKEAKARSSYGEKTQWWLLPLFVVLSVAISYGMTHLLPWLLSLFSL